MEKAGSFAAISMILQYFANAAGLVLPMIDTWSDSRWRVQFLSARDLLSQQFTIVVANVAVLRREILSTVMSYGYANRKSLVVAELQ